ncbi:hypothetical protein B0H16DRAFT_1892932 [Mycena metata]|uniref:MYND-type domain-containing protein n=1 Tax=Mycena metata TaxID=1033252 RepID=A0AAD7I1Q8_9AGAR|nr:hypothetical protein B0H16DRAFT_1892932 [Mycena metata]
MLHPWCLQDDDETEAELCQIFATTISSIYGHQEGNASCPPDPVIRTVVESTVGVQGLVMRAWVNSLLRRDFIAMHPSSLFMMRVASVQLDECVDGAGGTYWHLASFIVKLLCFISADPPAAQIHCAGALVLIAHMIRDQELLLTLLECGFFGALTKMLNAALDEDIDYDVEHDLERIIDILLLIYWSTPKVERWMAEGLEAKLLPALISITQRKQSYSAHKLIHAVSTSLVHYRVASRIETHLAEILPVLQRLIATGQKDKISENVGEFLAWGADRAKFIERFHAHRYVSRQACDNMKCGIILTRAQVRRCSQCRKRYYCSTVCQMIDWREDKHRTVCKNLRNVNPDYGSPIERSFMLALYESDFQAQKAALFRRQVMFIYENPGADFCCIYDYKSVPPTFGVYTLDNLPCTDPLWADSIARAHRSGGRMEMHLINPPDGTIEDVVDGRSGRGRIVPLRSSRADILVGIRAIARSLPPGVSDVNTLGGEIEEKVARLMKVTHDVVQVHCR